MDAKDAATTTLDDYFSALEKLPTELAWQVIDHAPEAALRMRLTSQGLKQQVDDYTRATRTTLVKKLSFADVRLPGSKKAPGYLGVMFDVCKPKSGLFYLRLFLLGLLDFKPEMKRLQNIKDEEPLFYNRNVMFCSVTGDKKHEEAAGLLEGIHLGQLKYTLADVMVDEDVRHLTSLIRAFRIEELSITVSYLNTSTDPVSVLRQLAAQVRSLFIYQTPNTNKDAAPRKYLFGANDVEWAEVILELFDGKLDKLCIKNPSYPEYLSCKGADKLKQAIPELPKKVWFMATCNKYDKMDYVVLNYDMKVNPAPAPPAHGNQNAQEAAKQFLQIKHQTRTNELSMDPYLVEDDIAETMKAK
ncbi:hypothetical protein PRIPAC_79675 [Pristionchus pacificus]|uniref:Uncharacterized protein n=1 Tax=Pristionchus pacificus TaxID=54126 RepID=A0A2A6BEJ5_PRIPA|nr:hypothetical protein PRIPAC_79675 [Pristionchus pacificus]|eukprot:PDM64276.1 hypothetical protein PRIPAC_53651 [Pristionchus pacificus]